MLQERRKVEQIEPAIVDAYIQTFVPRLDCYPVQLGNGRYIAVKRELTTTLVEAHLLGHITLGAYALDTQNRAKWICFDADTDEVWQQLLAMASELAKSSVAAFLEPSRRGGHLWLFTPLITGLEARRLAQELAEEHHLLKVEIFPKQDVLTTGTGSFVRLPLGRHRKTGRRYHFVDLAGQPIAPTIREQVELLGDPPRVSKAFIETVLSRAPKRETVSPTPAFQQLRKGEGGTLSERLKSRISVYDFVGQYVELDPQGKGLCPFHDDQHQSFGVNITRNFWHCYASCGGGSIVDFWMKWRGKNGEDPSFAATIKELADMLF